MHAKNVGRIQYVTFSSVGIHPLRLEGVLHSIDGRGPWPAAVVCHPHPLGGGTMHNGVVVAIAKALADQGVAALRFNFRGVGGSQGQYDTGRGEQADVAGAIEWILAQPGVDPNRILLAGYSFGAGVGFAYAQTDPRVAAVAAVGLAAEMFEVGSLLSFAGPKLFVSGELDQIAPVGALRRLVDQLPPPKTLDIVAGVDHFWQGSEQKVGRLVADFAGW
jgi:alpha/beta superfamily hydrolase